MFSDGIERGLEKDQPYHHPGMWTVKTGLSSGRPSERNRRRKGEEVATKEIEITKTLNEGRKKREFARSRKSQKALFKRAIFEKKVGKADRRVLSNE